MGALLSLADTKNRTTEYNGDSSSQTYKRQRILSSFYEENPRLIPCLPDEISVQILARLPRLYYSNAKLVSRKWKSTVTSDELFILRKELKVTEEWLYLLTKMEDDKLLWRAFDPLSKRWQKLPPMPDFVNEEAKKRLPSLWMWNMVEPKFKIADVIRGWLGRNNSFDRTPFCGCAIAAVDGCLYVVGGFSRASAMRCVWRFNPILNAWSEVTSMSTPRAYCKTSILDNKLYVVGGVSRGRGGLMPLQSGEVFDPCTNSWSEVPNMPFARAQVLPTAFLADMLKPIATGMTSYRGKLCVPQSLYSWPFFVDVGGELYDPETNSWTEMPSGMGEGWPARQAGTKLSIVVNGELYAFDPSSSLDSGNIKIYDQQEDSWKEVVGKVPICDFSESESPYLLAGFFGKLHVITRDVNHDIIILQADMNGQSSGSFSSTPSSMSNGSDRDVWEVIETKNFGSAELVSCQVLDI